MADIIGATCAVITGIAAAGSIVFAVLAFRSMRRTERMTRRR